MKSELLNDVLFCIISLNASFTSVTFGISESSKSVHNFMPTNSDILGTIEELFHTFHAEGKLGDTDVKKRNICLRVYVYEADVVRRFTSLNS